MASRDRAIGGVLPAMGRKPEHEFVSWEHFGRRKP
jgi:hypothetical protein